MLRETSTFWIISSGQMTRRGSQSHREGDCLSAPSLCGTAARARPRGDSAGRGAACPRSPEARIWPRPRQASSRARAGACQSLGLWPPVTSHCLLCPQTDTSDPEKVVSAFLKVSSVFKDEATVRTAVQDAVGNVGGGGAWVAPTSAALGLG